VDQQVVVVGHDLVSHDTDAVKLVHPMEDADKLLLVRIAKRSVQRCPGGPVVTVIPGVGVVDLDARCSHTRLKPRGGFFSGNIFVS
jgi:hypothetical protein